MANANMAKSGYSNERNALSHSKQRHRIARYKRIAGIATEKQTPTIVTEGKGTEHERQTLYHFNKDKRWTGITDGLGNRTQFILDDYDRPIRIINPNGSITENQYTGDNLTAIKQLIDTNPITKLPEWRTQQYLYDNNRLVEILDPHSHSTQLAYDHAGQIARITDANGR